VFLSRQIEVAGFKVAVFLAQSLPTFRPSRTHHVYQTRFGVVPQKRYHLLGIAPFWPRLAPVEFPMLVAHHGNSQPVGDLELRQPKVQAAFTQVVGEGLEGFGIDFEGANIRVILWFCSG
jgi:hypothetical protein